MQVGSWVGIKKVIGYQRGTFDGGSWQISPLATVLLASDKRVNPAAAGDWNIIAEIAVASGDAFIAQDLENSRIGEMTGAAAVDMNSFGLVSACANMKTPLLMWKVISDRADGRAGEDFRKFIAMYDGEGGRRIRQLLLALASTPNSPESYENIRKLMK